MAGVLPRRMQTGMTDKVDAPVSGVSMEGIRRLLEKVSAQSWALERARQIYADRLSPDFNVFDFIDSGEVHLSRLISWLLDPHGTHAQGGRFLSAFLEMLPGIERDDEVLSRCQVKCEAVTEAGRRIDICIFGEGWAVGIENKLRGAADGTDQVKDYLVELERRAPLGSRRCLVYLTLSSDQPPEHSLNPQEVEALSERGELHMMGVKDLVEWMEGCRIVCRSHRVSAFIEEFKAFLERDFEGIRDMTERDQLVEIATSGAHGASAVKLIMAAGDIKKKLLHDLTQQISFQCEGWEVLGSAGKGGRYEGVQIRSPAFQRAGLSICFEFQATSYNNLIFGVGKDKQIEQERPDLTSLLNGELGSGKSNSWWHWYRFASLADPTVPIEPNWAHNEAPWIDVLEGRMAERFVSFARQVNDLLSANGLLDSSGRPLSGSVQ